MFYFISHDLINVRYYVCVRQPDNGCGGSERKINYCRYVDCVLVNIHDDLNRVNKCLTVCCCLQIYTTTS